MHKKSTSIYILFFIFVGCLENCFGAKKFVPMDSEECIFLAKKISINFRVKDLAKSQEVILEIDRLLSKKDDLLYNYVRGWDFLREVISAQNEEVFKYFVTRGLALNKPDSHGEYIVHMVVRERLHSFLAFLCGLQSETSDKVYLVNLNMQNAEKLTPLALAQAMKDEIAQEILCYTRKRMLEQTGSNTKFDEADQEMLDMGWQDRSRK